MKVPPKRKGNLWNLDLPPPTSHPLNESPSEKEGKYEINPGEWVDIEAPSMKVPPKRKGNEGLGSLICLWIFSPQ